MASITSANTTQLINSLCLIERELFVRKYGLPSPPETPASSAFFVIVTNIPRGYRTMTIYDIFSKYGAIRNLKWHVDKHGHELNRLTVTYWNKEVATRIRKEGLYLAQDHKTFRDSVNIY